MGDGFEDAKSAADLRERKWSSSYCFHRARSCLSHVRSFEITAALKSRQPIWPAGRWWNNPGPRSKLERGTKRRSRQEARSDVVCRLHHQDAQRDTQQGAPVHELEQITQKLVVTNKSLSSPMSSSQQTCSPKRWLGLLSTMRKQENRELENGSESSWVCFRKQPLLPAV